VQHAREKPQRLDDARRIVVPFVFRGDEYCLLIDEPPSTPAAASELTAAEGQVLAQLCAGSTYEQIATTRGRSRHTIAKQVSSILRKLKVASLRDLELLYLNRTP